MAHYLGLPPPWQRLIDDDFGTVRRQHDGERERRGDNGLQAILDD